MKIDKIKITGVAVTAALCLFVFVFGESSVCFFRGLIGVPCPGCGMTRALYNAVCLNFEKAFMFHPLWPLVPPAVLYVLCCLFRGKKINNRLILAAGILLISVYVLRMFLFFPDTEPMTFNSDAFYVRLYKLVMRDIYGK